MTAMPSPAVLQFYTFCVFPVLVMCIVRNFAPGHHLQDLTRIFLSYDAVLHDCTQCHITTQYGLHLLTLQAPKRLTWASGVVVTRFVFQQIQDDHLLAMAAGCQPALLY